MPKYSKVKTLNEFELDNITDLRAMGNSGKDADKIGKDLLIQLRDDFVEADEYDRWDAPLQREEVIHELADGLALATPCR